MKINGGCHCGFITFEAEADPEKTSMCHCIDCQMLSGAPFRASVPVQDSAFRLLAGEPKVYLKTGESGNKRAQTFCPHCGSPIYATSVGEGPKVYNIRVGTIRQRNQFVPKRQIWVRSQQPWLGGLSMIPRVEKQT